MVYKVKHFLIFLFPICVSSLVEVSAKIFNLILIGLFFILALGFQEFFAYIG